MINNNIFTSTCHICIEELKYDPKKIKKKCCDTKAFICNDCWENLENSEINVCPICKTCIKQEEITLIEFSQENEATNSNEKKKKLIILLLIFEIVGFITINFNIWIFCKINGRTEYMEEIQYLIKNVIFWFMCLFIGWFTLCLIDILSCFKLIFFNKLFRS